MLFPKLQTKKQYRKHLDTFLGYRHQTRINEGEFYEMSNLSSHAFPVLSVRKPRELVTQSEEPISALLAKDRLCYVQDRCLVYGEDIYDLELSEVLPKTLISFGAYVIVFPDKVYFNTADPTDRGKIECSMVENQYLSIRWCDLEGNEYPTGQFHLGDTPPLTPEDGMFWIRAVGTETEIQQYYALNGAWAAPANLYLKLMFSSTDIPFQAHDTVLFRCRWAGENPLVSQRFRVVSVGENYLITDGIMRATRADSTQVQAELSKTLPMMDYVIECDNRLWGCYYGMVDGKLVNEIYASALGDFKNWSVFRGTSMDSYIASCGTDGCWTGVAKDSNGRVCFFKENYIHKVYGNYPANFQVQTIPCPGVERGCHRSLAQINGVLFYKGVDGIYAYDGSFPEKISHALGELPHGIGIGGAVDEKYYIESDALYVYDSGRRLWHREEPLNAECFCAFNGALYALNSEERQLLRLEGEGDEVIPWMAQTGVLSQPEQTYLQGLTVRMALEPGTRVTFLARYDSVGQWVPLVSVTGHSLRSFSLPLRVRRCDHLELRIEGKGNGKIFSMTRTFGKGSEQP